MLHHYSTKMVNNIWLMKDGKHVEVEFMSAFMLPATKKMTIRDFGYLQESRLYNVASLTHKQTETLYINFSRNMYAERPEWKNLLINIFKGKEVKVAIGAS